MKEPEARKIQYGKRVNGGLIHAFEVQSKTRRSICGSAYYGTIFTLGKIADSLSEVRNKTGRPYATLCLRCRRILNKNGDKIQEG